MDDSPYPPIPAFLRRRPEDDPPFRKQRRRKIRWKMPKYIPPEKIRKTKAQIAGLARLGWSRSSISSIRPSQADVIIAAGDEAPPRNRSRRRKS